MDRRPTVREVNRVSAEVAATIRALASLFPHRESYEPLDELAQRVQGELVEVGCAAVRAHRSRRSSRRWREVEAGPAVAGHRALDRELDDRLDRDGNGGDRGRGA